MPGNQPTRALIAASFLFALSACPPDPDPENPDDCFASDCRTRVHESQCPAGAAFDHCTMRVACTTDDDCSWQPFPGYCNPSADGGTLCTFPRADGTTEPACFIGSSVFGFTRTCGDGLRQLTCSDGRVCRARECIGGCAQWAPAPIACTFSRTLNVSLCQGPADTDLQNITCFEEDGGLSSFGCTELSDGGVAPDAGSIDAGSIDAGSTDAGSIDAGSIDAGSTDAGSTDAGSTDAGSTDAGSTDAGSTDAGSPDAGSTDAGSTILPDGGVIGLAQVFNFAFDHPLIATGDTATLTWAVSQEPAATCTVSPGNVSFTSDTTPTGSLQAGTSGTWTLSCTTAGGTVTRQATLQVIANTPPTATIDTPAMSMMFEVGDAVNFTGTCTDDGAGGATLNHWWHYGGMDPFISSDEDPGQVVLTTAGTFTVTYHCTDFFGIEDPTPPTVTLTIVDPMFASVKGARSTIGHTCGLTASGKLFCWGTSSFGVLGLGPMAVDTSRPKRVGSARWTTFDVGTQLSCAINAAHELWCWGWRDVGSIGNGMTTVQSSPVQLPGADWASVSIGNNHVCAVKTTGALHCWGENASGQLGLGADTNPQLTFTPVNGDLDWVAVSAGDGATCALKTGNRLFCWGLNDYGQLGTGGVMTSRVPVEIGAAIDWAQVQATSRTTCGVDLLGKAYCWGADFFGQLGDGTANNNVAGATKVPTQVGLASDWAEVHPGWSHTCGRKTTGTLWCWGADTNGQLGDGMPSSTNTLVPVQVGGDADWSQLSANDNYTCGVRAGGHAWCWGLNLRGVLGNGTTTNSSTPVEVRATP